MLENVEERTLLLDNALFLFTLHTGCMITDKKTIYDRWQASCDNYELITYSKIDKFHTTN
jgi:hypothetical protein